MFQYSREISYLAFPNASFGNTSFTVQIYLHSHRPTIISDMLKHEPKLTENIIDC